MVGPFQYLSSFAACLLLSPDIACRSTSTYPTFHEAITSTVYCLFRAPEPFDYVEWIAIANLILCTSIIAYCVYDTRLRRQRLFDLTRSSPRTGNPWDLSGASWRLVGGEDPWYKDKEQNDENQKVDYEQEDRELSESKGHSGFWTAVDNLCGYVLGYDPQSEDEEEQEEWKEVMM